MQDNVGFKKFIYTHILYVVIMSGIYYALASKFLRVQQKQWAYKYNDNLSIQLRLLVGFFLASIRLSDRTFRHRVYHIFGLNDEKH